MTMDFKTKGTFSLGRLAVIFTVILSVAQLLMIGVGALIVAYFPLMPLKEKAPWSGPIVKTMAAFAIVAFSFFLCRQAVRALRVSQQAERSHGPLTLLNLAVGLGLAIASGFLFLFTLMFSHGDDPAGAGYWAPIVLAGGGLLIFAVTCWVWWGSIIYAQKRLSEGRKPAAFLIASLPVIVLMGAMIWQPIYQLLVSLTHR